jgi:hypothetical protein
MISSSSVHLAPSALGSISTVKVLIPSLLELPAILDNKTGDPGQFLRAKTTTARKRDWREPELCDGIVTLDMDVGRLAILVRVEEEAIRSVNEDGRHAEMLHGRHSRNHPELFLAHRSFRPVTRRSTSDATAPASAAPRRSSSSAASRGRAEGH